MHYVNMKSRDKPRTDTRDAEKQPQANRTNITHKSD